jgi:hypothetical protein
MGERHKEGEIRHFAISNYLDESLIATNLLPILGSHRILKA